MSVQYIYIQQFLFKEKRSVAWLLRSSKLLEFFIWCRGSYLIHAPPIPAGHVVCHYSMDENKFFSVHSPLKSKRLLNQKLQELSPASSISSRERFRCFTLHAGSISLSLTSTPPTTPFFLDPRRRRQINSARRSMHWRKKDRRQKN